MELQLDNRFDVIGCRINHLKNDEAVDSLISHAESGEGGYVCFVNVHVSVMAKEDPGLREIINNSYLSFPDGKPLYWVGQLKGIKKIERIAGPNFFVSLMGAKNSPPLKHYFYGSRPEVLESLVKHVNKEFPEAKIVGYESPPFRELTPEEREAALSRIRSAHPDFVWVGLGAPKQEFWMEQNWQALRPAILLGVGAAFDFHAGFITRAPHWIQKIGFEWLHRLIQEPGRLWKRYLYTNTMFLWHLLFSSCGLKKQ